MRKACEKLDVHGSEVNISGGDFCIQNGKLIVDIGANSGNVIYIN